MAVIIRTAGMNRTREDLFRDFKALAKTWDRIDKGAQLGRAPTLLYREPELVVRTIRDYLSPDIEEIFIDNEDEFEDTKTYFDERMPDLAKILSLYEGKQPIFEKFGIEAAIDELYERNVKLPSGGELVIDQTEALVAVDVNSSKSTKEGKIILSTIEYMPIANRIAKYESSNNVNYEEKIYVQKALGKYILVTDLIEK